MAFIDYKPDFSSATVLTDPNPNAEWTPSLTNGVDYILSCPEKRTATLRIQGGRHVGVIGAYMSHRTNGGPLIRIAGGTSGRKVWLEGILWDCTEGAESDGIRTAQTPTLADTTHIYIYRCRMENLRGQSNGTTDDFGNASSATHADCIQLAGGAAGLYIAKSTFSSRYAIFQLQREMVLNGDNTAKNITSATFNGTTDVGTFGVTAHGYSVNDWIEITGTNPTGWIGCFQVTEVVNANSFRLNMEAFNPGTYVSGGTARRAVFEYNVGNVEIEDVNVHCLPNGQMYLTQAPAETLQVVRIGARSATKSGVEDRSALPRDGWAGTASFTNFYVTRLNNSLGGLVNPGNGVNVFPDVQATISGVEASWPSWPAVTGKIIEGMPPGGEDYCPRALVGIGYPRARPF